MVSAMRTDLPPAVTEVRKGIILAAGYGTRFLPATKIVPKEMLPILDMPIITLIVEEFIRSGITTIMIVISRRKRLIEDYFDHELELEALLRQQKNTALLARIAPPPVRLEFVRQRTMSGTGHALLQATSFVAGEPVVVAYPDDVHIGDPPLSAQLIETWRTSGCAVLATVSDPPDLQRYGVVRLAEDGERVVAIVEKPAPGSEPSREASIGRFLYPPRFFDHLRSGWEQHLQRHGQEREYYHTYALECLIAEGQVVRRRLQGQRLDVGEPTGYLRSIVSYALQTPPYRQIVLETVSQTLADEQARASQASARRS